MLKRETLVAEVDAEIRRYDGIVQECRDVLYLAEERIVKTRADVAARIDAVLAMKGVLQKGLAAVLEVMDEADRPRCAPEPVDAKSQA